MPSWDPATLAPAAPLLLALLAAHALGDFVLQSTKLVRKKAQLKPLAFLEHGLVHAALAWLLIASPQQLWTGRIALLVFAVHLVIDLTKELLRRWHRGRGTLDAPRQLALFTGDQIAHLVSLVAIAMLGTPRLVPFEVFANATTVAAYQLALVYLTGWIVSVRTGAIVIGLAVARYQPDLREGKREHHDAVIATESRGLEGGGQMIGALERTLIFVLALLGVWAGIGFLLTAKSILRFGDANDAKNRRLAEYIIIGTLMSFTWALVVAIATQRVAWYFAR